MQKRATATSTVVGPGRFRVKTPPARRPPQPALNPPVDRSPLYVRLAAEFIGQIEAGVLRVGEKLPSIRVLRRGRRVSAATVTAAYLRLERDGYVVARDRSGFYVALPASRARPEPQRLATVIPPAPVGISQLVADVLRQTGDPKLLPLGVSTMTPALLPIARLNRAFRRALVRAPQHSARYTGMLGHLSLRRQIARRTLASGAACDPDDVIVTSGGIDALNLALRAVAEPGDVVAVESPTYFGVLQALEALRLRALEVPTDSRTGFDLDLLDRAIRRHRVKAVLTMTTCHNPMGFVMSDDAKAELVAVTARHDVPLIEDGVYAELVYDETRRRPAKAFDRKGLVLFCGSFSKVLAPGLRVGWLESARFRDRLEALKGITSLMTSALPQLAVADLLDSGFYERYLKRLRQQAADQTRQYIRALGESLPSGARISRPAGGNLAWVQLPRRVDGTLLYRRLLDQGIGIFPGEIFSSGGKHRSFVRISAGTPWSPAIERAIGTLGRACRDLMR